MSKPTLRFVTRVERKRRSFESGQKAEREVERWLVDQGHQILARNVRFKSGEIDLVCVKEDRPHCLVIVEVRSVQKSRPADLWVDSMKRRKLVRAVQCFLALPQAKPFKECRLDLVTCEAGQMTHYPGYFSGEV